MVSLDCCSLAIRWCCVFLRILRYAILYLLREQQWQPRSALLLYRMLRLPPWFHLPKPVRLRVLPSRNLLELVCLVLVYVMRSRDIRWRKRFVRLCYVPCAKQSGIPHGCGVRARARMRLMPTLARRRYLVQPLPCGILERIRFGRRLNLCAVCGP